jgi:osmotically-inducible protein OsmY
MGTATKGMRTDEQIQRDVLEELKWNARVQPNEIGVAVKDGIVTLIGWVDSYAKKWAADDVIHRVRGVKAIANDIEVRLPGSAERTDADVAASVCRALEWDALVPVDNIQVTVDKGWVTLRGAVEWAYQKVDAERVVHRLLGVRGVTNLITIHPTVKPSPESIKRKIEDALVRSAETDAQGIKVETRGDKVILRGSVHSWAERQEAERVAWSSPGVTSVEDDITIAL